jgi:hypothetical protein
MLEAALPLVTEGERSKLLNTVLERLVLQRPGRWMIYDPVQAGGLTELICFASDFWKQPSASSVKTLGKE